VCVCLSLCVCDCVLYKECICVVKQVCRSVCMWMYVRLCVHCRVWTLTLMVISNSLSQLTIG